MLAGGGAAIMAPIDLVRRFHRKLLAAMRSRTPLLILTTVSLALGGAIPLAGQAVGEPGRADALARNHPELHDLTVRLDRAHGVLLGALAREGRAVRASGDVAPTPGFEAAMIDRLTALLRGGGRADDVAAAAEAGYAALGVRGSEVVRRGLAFQREVLSILSDPSVADPGAALADAVARYRSRPDRALPAAPKDMDVLYGHPYALAFRTQYQELDGLVWAGHWLRLAATEPMTDLPAGAERQAGIDTVMTRFEAKLSYGDPPNSFPSEIPLAPAIAPGLIWHSPQAAMIWDNHSMLLEVLGDVLASPEASDVPMAIEGALDFFLDGETAMTDRDAWEIMALRHGIFFQGGFPLAVMTQSERNTGGHAAHLAGGAPLMVIPGMPRR